MHSAFMPARLWRKIVRRLHGIQRLLSEYFDGNKWNGRSSPSRIFWFCVRPTMSKVLLREFMEPNSGEWAFDFRFHDSYFSIIPRNYYQNGNVLYDANSNRRTKDEYSIKLTFNPKENTSGMELLVCHKDKQRNTYRYKYIPYGKWVMSKTINKLCHQIMSSICSYDRIDCLHVYHNQRLFVFTRFAECSWTMFTLLLIHLSHWLFAPNISPIVSESHWANRVQNHRLSYLLSIYVSISLGKCHQLRYLAKILVKISFDFIWNAHLNLNCISFLFCLFVASRKTITKSTPHSKQRQVLYYTVYALGLPILLTVIAVLIDLDDSLVPEEYKPKIGVNRCFLGGEILYQIFHKIHSN